MMRFVLILLPGFLVFFPPLNAEEPSLTAHAQKVDNFVKRTKDRISESWNFCYFEFKLAFYHLGDKQVYVERDIKARADAAIDQAKDYAAKNIGEKIDEAKDKIIDSSKEEIQKRLDNVHK